MILQLLDTSMLMISNEYFRPIYTGELPRVLAHNSLFVLLHPGVSVLIHARAQNYPTQQNRQTIVHGYSWQLLSVD